MIFNKLTSSILQNTLYPFIYQRFLADREFVHEKEWELQRTKERLERTIFELKRSQKELKQANDRLKVLASTDPLTGLFNRRRGLEILGVEMSRVARGNQAVSLIMLDLDHFKSINDKWGHRSGDAVLVEVAKRLRAACRPHDAVVRWGGEELLIVCPHTDSDQVEALAHRLMCVLSDRDYAISSSDFVRVTASLGLASTDLFPEAGVEELVELADAAMYQAKREGRHRVRSSLPPLPLAAGMNG